MGPVSVSDDGNLRPTFRDHLRVGFHWQTVETGLVSPGCPDSNFGSAGVERWIEFKQTAGWTCTLRTEQVGWHVLRHLVGGVSFIATRRWHDGGPRKGPAVDELWLHDGRWSRELVTSGLRAVDPLGWWSDGPSSWNWDEIREILIDRRS